jgi:hypothetical protein
VSVTTRAKISPVRKAGRARERKKVAAKDPRAAKILAQAEK